jgi:hypothetical protein
MRLWLLMLDARDGVWFEPVLEMLCTEAIELSTEGRCRLCCTGETGSFWPDWLNIG